MAFDQPGTAIGDVLDVVFDQDFVGLVDVEICAVGGVEGDAESAEWTFPVEHQTSFVGKTASMLGE